MSKKNFLRQWEKDGKVLPSVPEGWKEKFANTCPNGYKFYTNGKSWFDKDFRSGIVKVQENG